ncbi:MAG: acyl-CoA dehydrogenase family protein [Pseudomonadota bacterium]
MSAVHTGWRTEEHALFQNSVRRFFAEHVAPNEEAWSERGAVDRNLWKLAGEAGLMGSGIPEDFGGYGGDYGFDAIVLEEQGRACALGWGFIVQTIVKHYIVQYGLDWQKSRWLPELVTGELIPAIAMTEPGTGSDLKAIRTRAVKHGDDYVINGSKIFISNGQLANFIVLVARTSDDQGSKSISLIGLETDELAGFKRGKNLDKLGMKAQDTSELFFEDVRVPAENLLGAEEGQGFYQLMKQLPWERLCLAFWALGSCDAVLEQTLGYVSDRRAFGQRIMDFQNSRFKLAECKTKIEVTRAFVDQCMMRANVSELSASEASMAKWWSTEVQGQVVDECLQLHGGYGYMNEYPVARFYADARVQRIYGGTTEIMKELIARELDPG